MNSIQRKAIGEFLSIEMARIKESLRAENGQSIIDNIETNGKERSSFITKYRSIALDSQSFFVVLRKWNSYTPSLPSLNNQNSLNQYSVGGGYFLYIKGDAFKRGYGLVIDPGYNFIHNFGQAGFCLDDIDGILITHAHNDHTNDFESLLSLLYQRNTNLKQRKKQKRVDLFLNVGSFKKFSNYLDLANTDDSKSYIGNVAVMGPGQVHQISGREDINLNILTLYTKHNEIITNDYSLGICFVVNGKKILLSGDTGWNFDIYEKNKKFLLETMDIMPKYDHVDEENNIDVIIAHLGSIKEQEFKINEDGGNLEECFYKSHLGLLGIFLNLATWSPNLCIISEFGEEFIDSREKLTRQVETTANNINTEICCIPGDVGLFIVIPSLKVLEYSNQTLIDYHSLQYIDMPHETNERSIKYFDERNLQNIAPEIRKTTLKNLEIKDCIKYYKIKRFLEIDSDLNISLLGITQNASDQEILQVLNTWRAEDGVPVLKNLLIGTSYVLIDPMNIIDLLITCPNVEVIEEFLSNYEINIEFWKECNLICINKNLAADKLTVKKKEILDFIKSEEMLKIKEVVPSLVMGKILSDI